MQKSQFALKKVKIKCFTYRKCREIYGVSDNLATLFFLAKLDFFQESSGKLVLFAIFKCFLMVLSIYAVSYIHLIVAFMIIDILRAQKLSLLRSVYHWN